MGNETGESASFELGDFELGGGSVLRNARLVYRTYGTLALVALRAA
jgi:homoserine acetyltransferase